MAITVSILQGGTNSHATSSEEANFTRTDLMSPGVVGAITNTSGVAPATGAFAVNAQGTPDMTVAVSAGAGIVTATPTSGNSQAVRAKNSASANVTISANSTGGTRFDWLYIKIDPDKAKDPASDASDVATLVTSRSTSATTDNGTPPTYGTILAVITVANGASSITNGNIADKRVRAAALAGINDDNGNEIVKVSSTASAVNEFTMANAATGNGPTLSATGSDSNINVNITPKGTGRVVLNGAGAIQSATVATTETTTSTSYADLTTTTDTVTATIGPSGAALVCVSSKLYNSVSTSESFVSFAVSGASTVAAADSVALHLLASGVNLPQVSASKVSYVTGLTAGSNTFKMKYRVTANTGGFQNRNIWVMPL